MNQKTLIEKEFPIKIRWIANEIKTAEKQTTEFFYHHPFHDAIFSSFNIIK